MKKTKGFTLVELVVVIAIVGVLAAILVPTMLTYIRKAKLKSANTNAKTAYNAVAEFITEKNATLGMSVDDVITTYGGQPIDCNIPPNTSMNVYQLAVHYVLANNGISSGHVWAGQAIINGEKEVYVQWTGDASATNASNPVVGQYPNPVSWDTYNSPQNHWESYISPV